MKLKANEMQDKFDQIEVIARQVQKDCKQRMLDVHRELAKLSKDGVYENQGEINDLNQELQELGIQNEHACDILRTINIDPMSTVVNLK